MFWKKKKDSGEFLLKNVGDKHRAAFRYVFQHEAAPAMEFLGKAVQVINLSAGGMAFGDEGFQVGDRDRITMALDIPARQFSAVFNAELKILTISNDNICHCHFENCSDGDFEILHKYVLELQKKDLQQPVP